MKKKKPFSKVVVVWVFLLVTAFIIFSCYEMHRLGDLSPIAYIGTGIVGLLATVVGTYMWRAKQQDVHDLEMAKIREKAELRQELGQHYRDEVVDTVEEFDTNGVF